MSYKYEPYKRRSDRETLDRIKRWPALVSRFSYVRIFSAEHNAYWSGAGNGYTGDLRESDVWCAIEAYNRTKHCGPEKRIQYVEAEKQDPIDWRKRAEDAEADNVKLMAEIVGLNQELSSSEAELNAFAKIVDENNKLAESPWVSVEDDVPDEGVNVIVLGGCAFLSGGRWYSSSDGHREINWKVTHYMPIPELPKNSKPLEKEADV